MTTTDSIPQEAVEVCPTCGALPCDQVTAPADHQTSAPGGLHYTLDDYENAARGSGPLAYEWSDKPHKLLFDLVKALRTATPSPAEGGGAVAWRALDAVKAERDAYKADYVRVLQEMLAAKKASSDAILGAVEDYCSEMPDLAGHGHSVGLKDAIRAALAPASEPAHQASGDGWRTMDSAPKGKAGYSWMLLLHGDEEDPTVSNGMRYGDQYFAAALFYVGGPFDQRQYAFREVEVKPLRWMPLPAALRKEQP